MDALDLFFDDAKKLDKDGLCVGQNIDIVALTAEFTDFPTELVLDAAAATDLNSEYLLFRKADGQKVLRIVKEYKAGKAAEVFVDATAPILGQGHPILLKQADLRKLGRDLGLENSIPAADRVKNPPWRNAIFQHFADEAQVVRRQGFWNQWQFKLSEGSAHLVGLIMRLAGGDASVALRVSFV